jgi:hypothetical protein
MRIGARNVAAIGLLALGACGGGMTTSNEKSERLHSLADVSEAQWAALAQRRVFFGHQSVGGNIMDGVADVLKANPGIRLNVVESRDLSGSTRPGFHHALIGRNDFPLEKFDDFAKVASTGFGSEGGIAMLKLCYIDIHRHTDAQDLFEQYRRRVDAVRAKNPTLTIVHFTSPLTSIENWKGRLRASLTGSATQRERNAVRHRYNELLRQAYQGREPLFDIARLESTLPDGKGVFFRVGDEAVPLLAPEYTDDGGHLNAPARRMVAEQLLIMLAQLEPRPGASIASKGM